MGSAERGRLLVLLVLVWDREAMTMAGDDVLAFCFCWGTDARRACRQSLPPFSLNWYSIANVSPHLFPPSTDFHVAYLHTLDLSLCTLNNSTIISCPRQCNVAKRIHLVFEAA